LDEREKTAALENDYVIKKNSLVYPLVTFIDGFVPPWPVGNAPTIEELFSTFLTSARYDYV